MVLPRELLSVLDKYDGIITSGQANAVGISNERLRLLVNQGILEGVAHGIYISSDEFPDKMYIAQIQNDLLS